MRIAITFFLILFSVVGNSQLIIGIIPSLQQERLDTLEIVPPEPLQGQQARTLATEDIAHITQYIESFETNTQGYLLDEWAMFKHDDVKYTNSKEDGLLDTLLDPLYSWLVGVENLSNSWMPQHFTFETKFPTRIDTVKYWRFSGVNGSSKKGVKIWGSNDGLNWKSITDNFSWTFSRRFSEVHPTDTNHYRHFKIERWNNDPRGYGSVRMSQAIKLLLIAHIDSTREEKKYLDLDSIPTPDDVFAKGMGTNAWYYDSTKYKTEYKAISQFVNSTWHITGDGQPFAIRRNYKEQYVYYLNSEDGGNLFPDSLDRPIQMFRDGYPENLEAQRRGGIDFVMHRVQLNPDGWLNDSSQQFYAEITALGDSNIRLSNTIYLTDTIYGRPKYFGKQPVVWTDTTEANLIDTTYDWRPLLVDKWDSVYYDVGDTNSDWLGNRFYDKETKVWKSLKDAMIMPPRFIAYLADTSKMDSIINYLGHYRELAEFAFNYSAVYGRNGNIPLSDLRVLSEVRVETGIDVVNAMSFENEFDKSWRNGLGRSLPQVLGMMWSVLYDGHGGLVQDMNGGYRVGLHTADSTMIFGTGSELQSDMPMSIEAMRWAEYYRARDFASMPSTHPYSGEKKHIKFKNILFDFHDYRTSTGNSSNQDDTDQDAYATTFEKTPNALDVLQMLKIVRKEWLDALIVTSEFGYSHSKKNRFSVPFEYFNNSDSTSFDPDYDITYAQASNNCWDFMHRDRHLDYYFHYEAVDENTYYAPIDTTTTPLSLDRSRVWSESSQTTGFPSHGLRCHTNRVGVRKSWAGVPKPAWYALDAQLDLIGNSKQVGYVYDTINEVAYFTYYDADNDYYSLCIRRVTSFNQTTENYTIPIPDGYGTVTRIEPIRNEPTLETVSLGSGLTTYQTDVREKLFFLKCEP